MIPSLFTNLWHNTDIKKKGGTKNGVITFFQHKQIAKKRSMTQEQLAEALGVTFASVSKWERGVATPELNLIAEMADLFGVSFDALVGFKIQNGSAIALEERIHQLQRDKKIDEAITEAEKALIRYPNDFRIVHRAGELYAIASIERNNEKHLFRCIELLEQSSTGWKLQRFCIF